MATYKEIKGVTVQTRDEDPVQNVGTWASGGSMSTARSAAGGDGGTSTAAFAAGSGTPSPTNYITTHEQYNGTSWTSSTSMNTARAYGGAGGTYTASFVATGRINGSSVTANTELWDGSSWTEVNEVNNGRFSCGSGIGTQTAGLIAAGTTVPALKDNTESWNGTNWTELGAYDGTASEGINMFGTNTAAILAGGYTGSSPRGGSASWVSPAYSWNGSSFTATTALPSTRASGGSVGTTTDGLIAGGYDGSSNIASTLSWDSSTWTEVNDLSSAGQGWGSSKGGTTQDTIVFGAGNTTTENFSFPPVTQDKLKEGMIFLSGGTTLKGFGKAAGVPAGTWASGGSTNAATYSRAGAGTQDAALLSGGNGSSATNEEYNGTTWTEKSDLNTGREALAASRSGTTTASLVFSGEVPSPSYLANNESWDGSSWTDVGNLNTARRFSTGSGTQTAAIIFSGDTGSNTANTETWNGSSWTEVNNLNTARQQVAGSGIQTAALATGGNTPPPATVAITESWDGTSWTEVGDLNTARRILGAAGRSGNSDALAFGGLEPSTSAKTEYYNGSSWSEQNDLSTARRAYNSGNGTSFAAILGGGYTTTGVANTEEFTANDTLADITVS